MLGRLAALPVILLELAISAYTDFGNDEIAIESTDKDATKNLIN